VYLLSERGVPPESILVATFTDKAAKELITRISDALDEHNLRVNVNDLYVGTFHSIALRIIKENLECTRLNQGFRVLDQFDQAYLVFQNFYRFANIEDIDVLLRQKSTWYKARKICGWVNSLAEELITPEILATEETIEAQVLTRVYLKYNELLVEQNMLDFTGIQVEALRMLTKVPEVASKYHEALNHLMVDEYQDTNYIQEQLVFALANSHNNICVVGDDDQGLYRF
jgi:superfamily I DNA and RNA helicases